MRPRWSLLPVPGSRFPIQARYYSLCVINRMVPFFVTFRLISAREDKWLGYPVCIEHEILHICQGLHIATTWKILEWSIDFHIPYQIDYYMKHYKSPSFQGPRHTTRQRKRVKIWLPLWQKKTRRKEEKVSNSLTVSTSI